MKQLFCKPIFKLLLLLEICYTLNWVRLEKSKLLYFYNNGFERLFMKRNNNIFGDKHFLSTLGFLACLCLMIGLVFWAVSDREEIKILSYTELVKSTEQKMISDALIQKDNTVTGALADGSKYFCRAVLTEEFLSKMVNHGVDVKFEEVVNGSWFLNMLILLLIILIGGLGYLAFSFFRGASCGGGGGGKLFQVGKSKAKFYPADAVKTKFSDVAGVVSAKEDLQDVITFLKNPGMFKDIGARIPRGVLLEGNPGNGKTLLAKAVAGEAGCPFLSISGSDFVEVFVGVGASRVRDLFAQARKHAPCIVFIDEIDSVARKREGGYGGASDERDQTLNQLLAEMDGFSTEAGEVIVIAATNRVDILDKALLRPGRFDKIVNVPYPDLRSRIDILQVHAKNIKLESNVDLSVVARGTPGWSGADLANLLNEAAIAAVKGGRKLVDMRDVEAARDKIYLGSENKSLIRTAEELRETAFHEAGHTLMNLLMPATDPFFKVTIVARGHALGVSSSLPERDVHVNDSGYLMARIVVALGGLIAEKIALKKHTTGVSSDLSAATSVARNMVLRYGMSDLGPICYVNDSYYRYSDITGEKIDAEVTKIVNEAYRIGEQLMQDNLDKLTILAEALLEKETLEAREVYVLLGITPRATHSMIESDKVVAVEGKADIAKDLGAASSEEGSKTSDKEEDSNDQKGSD